MLPPTRMLAARNLAARNLATMVTLILATTLLGGVPAASAAPAADRVTAKHAADPKAKPRAGTADAIRVVSRKRQGNRLVRLVVRTPSLQRPVRVIVILPQGYRAQKNRKRHYPSVYLLHGTSNDPDAWLWGIHAARALRGKDVIGIAPDGAYAANGGSFYTDWVDQKTPLGTANWETFHNLELVPWIDRHFRTIDRRAKRAIAGISQGAFGSFSYAARHRHLYGAAASFSGAIDVFKYPLTRLGGGVLVSAIMTGLNQVQPFAPFGDPATHAATWRAHNPASIVRRLKNTRLDVYVGSGIPGEPDTPADWIGPAQMESIISISTAGWCAAADAAGVDYRLVRRSRGTHAWVWGERSFKNWTPHLMRFFRTGR